MQWASINTNSQEVDYIVVLGRLGRLREKFAAEAQKRGLSSVDLMKQAATEAKKRGLSGVELMKQAKDPNAPKRPLSAYLEFVRQHL